MVDKRSAERAGGWAPVSLLVLLLLAGGSALLFTVGRQDAVAPEKPVEEAEERVEVTQRPRTFKSSAIPEEVLARMRTLAQPVRDAAAAKTSEARPLATPPAARRRSVGATEDGAGDGTGDFRSAAAGEDLGTAVLDIEVDGERLDQAAAHFGYALAAFYLSAGDTALLGLFEGDRLRYPSMEELQGFSGRGRSAEKLPGRGLYRQAAARRSGLESGKIRLLFLVPRKVDEEWLKWQKEVVGRHGYRFEEVAAVRARYGEGFELVACELVLKEGGIMSLEGGER